MGFFGSRKLSSQQIAQLPLYYRGDIRYIRVFGLIILWGIRPDKDTK